jgi:hypothetical protein
MSDGEVRKAKERQAMPKRQAGTTPSNTQQGKVKTDCINS